MSTWSRSSYHDFPGSSKVVAWTQEEREGQERSCNDDIKLGGQGVPLFKTPKKNGQSWQYNGSQFVNRLEVTYG